MSNSVCGTGSGEKNAISINSKKIKEEQTQSQNERSRGKYMHERKNRRYASGGKKWQADEWI